MIYTVNIIFQTFINAKDLYTRIPTKNVRLVQKAKGQVIALKRRGFKFSSCT